MSTAIVVTSGKGGTGKTSVTGGLASCLAALGHRVLCIDMDIGLRNLDLALGMSDRALMDFTDVVEGRCPLARAVVEHPVVKNLFLLTAPLTPRPIGESSMRALIREAKGSFDFILMDSPAGLGSGFRLAVCGAGLFHQHAGGLEQDAGRAAPCGTPSGPSVNCGETSPAASTWWSTGSSPSC